jgi:hypothetical protein
VGHSGNAAVAQYGHHGGGGVLGSKTKHHGRRRLEIHIYVPHRAKLKKVTVEVNGKIVSVLEGRQASADIQLNLPCSKGETTVVVIAVTDSGKTITQSYTYRHLC